MHNRILGIDPGSQLLGWAILDQSPKLRYLGSGTLKLNSQSFYERLGLLFHQLKEIAQTYQPHYLVLEKSFVSANKDVALKLGQVRGALMAFGASENLQFDEYAPRQVKKTVAGYGAASKEQVFQMCQYTLADMPDLVTTLDESDAIALALCHHFSHRWSVSTQSMTK